MSWHHCTYEDDYGLECEENVWVEWGDDEDSARCDEHQEYDYGNSDDDERDNESESEWADIEVLVRGECWTVFTLDDFYKHAYGQEQRTKLGDLGHREKRDLGMKIRDHIAQGRVYICSLYLSDADMEELEGDNYDSWNQLANTDASLVKIGYSKYPVEDRMDQLIRQCDNEQPRVLAMFPSERQDSMGFAHLLEKIIHELCSERQVDIYCHGCGRTHTEYFVFEEIGRCTKKESARLHVDSIKRDIAKWQSAIQDLDGLYHDIAFVQRNMLDKIKKHLRGSKYNAPW
ncbi:hypothetical protein BG006_008910 [Podila minutissima]|uniref:Bacteriophage T5 Orf172 DNA-binding domain-containing protein n=1 Tax=Podila minutissima TaxID=64525 RepID=A0A9P5VJA1_9FUNG|nr:hypothetical protein BG006_008910 [Podila minutissima]